MLLELSTPRVLRVLLFEYYMADPRGLPLPPLTMFRKICQWPHDVALLRALADTFGLVADDVKGRYNLALRMACQSGQVSTVAWLADTFALDGADARTMNNAPFCTACEYGHKDLAQYLVRRFHLTSTDVCQGFPQYMHTARQKGHLSLVRWLLSDLAPLLRPKLRDGSAICIF